MNNNQPATPPPHVAMIISGALILGVLMIAGICISMRGGINQPPRGELSALTMAGTGVVTFVMSLLIPDLFATQFIKQQEQTKGSLTESDLRGTYQGRQVLRMGLLEVGAIANLMAFSMDGQVWSLYVAGWLLLTMIAFFPTPGRIQDWVKNRQELLQFENQ